MVLDERQPTPEETPSIGFAEVWGALWRWLQSVRTTFYLLVILAFACLVGIVVPQGAPPETYAAGYGALLGTLLVKLGLHQVFTSAWFVLLLLLVTISAVACARRIWRVGLAQIAGPSLAALQRGMQRDAEMREEAVVASEPEAATQALAGGLRRARFRVETAEQEGARWLVGRKHRWAGAGLILSHFAIFAIAAGAIIGLLPGLSLDKPIYITEGETYHQHGEFDFALKLNAFVMEYYPDGRTVKSYKSDVSVLEGGEEIKRQVIMVNRPLSHHAINFYQSTWGVAGFRVQVTRPGKEPEVLNFPVQLMQAHEESGIDSFEVPEKDAVRFTADEEVAVVVRGYTPDAWEKDGEIVGFRSTEPRNPAAWLMVVSDFTGGSHNLEEIGWIKEGEPVTKGEVTVELQSTRLYTGLTARRDYGVPLVWLGFALLTVGLVAAFYCVPQTVVAALTPADDGTHVRLLTYRKGGGSRWVASANSLLTHLLPKE